MHEITNITLRGVFDESDIRELMLTIRRINERRPDLNYHIELGEMTDLPAGEVAEMLERIYPVRPGHELEIKLFPRQDRSSEVS